MTCRTRFAPSPSGDLHVGGARTALFCWALAKKHDGDFLLRIEDTDQKRSSDAASLGFLRDLRWLGIGWDEGPEDEGFGGGDHGPYFQSQRLSVYQEHLQRLIDAGMAYPAFETGEELAAARDQARAEKRPYRYDRAALRLDPVEVQSRLDQGEDHVIRFRVPDDSEVVIQDEVLGEVRIAPGEVDDFVIRKADGFPTYHFAVVVDDASMAVTHVVRGQEHLANTPRHVLLQQALGFDRPVYAHLPLIQNPDGSKMSKRDKDKALRKEIKDRGLTSSDSVDPESWEAWLGDKTRQLPHQCAERLADELGIDLPEVSVVSCSGRSVSVADHSPVALDLNELCLNGADDQQEQGCHQQSPEELGSQMGGRHCVEGQENVPWRRLGSRKSLESGLSALMKGWLEENGRDG